MGDYPEYVITSDVFMFAMVMLETITNELPWETSRQASGSNAANDTYRQLREAMGSHSRPQDFMVQALNQLPTANLPPGFADLIIACGRMLPRRRPQWSEVYPFIQIASLIFLYVVPLAACSYCFFSQRWPQMCCSWMTSIRTMDG